MINKCNSSKLTLAATQRLKTMIHLKGKQRFLMITFKKCIYFVFILDSDFQHLAQMSQAHTLVGLARSPNVNPKFFLAPRNMSWTKDVPINNNYNNYFILLE